MMKRLFFSIMATAVVAVAPVSADSVVFTNSIYASGGGGEFTAVLSGDLNGQLVGLPSDLTATSFQTFCLESRIQFIPGTSYSYTINEHAITGGANGPNPDPVDDRTAFLYTYFRKGLLTDVDGSAALGYYDLDDSEGLRKAHANELQKAIWYIENEDGGVNNRFVALADAAVALGGVWYGKGLGSVRAINPYNTSGEAQSQLTMIPLPMPAGLAAVGLIGIGIVARFRRRTI